MSKTLEANSVFLNPTHTDCPTKVNQMLKYCYASLNLLDQLKGQIGSDQFNYIDEYFHRIISTLQSVQVTTPLVGVQVTTPLVGVPQTRNPQFNLFVKNYTRDNLNKVPKAYANYTINTNLANAEYNNQTLSVPNEYKVLTTLDKQLAFNKYGERIVVPYVEKEDVNPFAESQYIAGNGFDIDRHMKPMPLNKYK